MPSTITAIQHSGKQNGFRPAVIYQQRCGTIAECNTLHAKHPCFCKGKTVKVTGSIPFKKRKPVHEVSQRKMIRVRLIFSTSTCCWARFVHLFITKLMALPLQKKRTQEHQVGGRKAMPVRHAIKGKSGGALPGVFTMIIKQTVSPGKHRVRVNRLGKRHTSGL